jgi:hypothetical protein
MIDKNKIAILVTAHTDTESRMFMTEKLCELLSKTGYYVCLVSHTPVTETILKNCNGFVYDSNNDFSVDGQKHPAGHAVAELRSVLDGVEFLQQRGFTHIFKTCYDINPLTDFNKIIEFFSSIDKRCVAVHHSFYLNTLSYFCEIEFLKQTYNFEALRKYNQIIEGVWYHSVESNGLLDQVFKFNGPKDNELLQIDASEEFHFSGNDGYLNIEKYKEKIK